jgi:DNA-binding HxlR family transcriptional regulator
VLGKDYERQHCALASALEVLGERWTLLIVRDAFFGVRRYSDFVARLDIPRAVLSDRLKSLVDQGVLVRRDDPARAGRGLYELTPAGKELWPALHALIAWGSKHRRRAAFSYRHAACGTELAVGALCPSCRIVPPPEDVAMIPRRRRRTTTDGRTDAVSTMIHRPRRLLEPVDAVGAADADAVKLGA